MFAWTGIGARETPQEIFDLMIEISLYMNDWNWILRSGGAAGADTAFEMGTNKKEIYLPWKNFRDNPSSLYLFSSSVNSGSAIAMAEKVWDLRYKAGNVKVKWNSLKDVTKKFMIRNIFQIFGAEVNNLSRMIFCWTKDGEASGGTGMAIFTAEMFNKAQYNKVEKGIREIKHQIHKDGTQGSAYIKIFNLQKADVRISIRNMLKSKTDPILMCEPDYYKEK